MMSDLPNDLLEEVLSRLPLTSLRGFRAVCEKWNLLSKDRSFTRKHLAQAKARAKRELMVVVVMNFRVSLVGINLQEGGVDPSISHQGKLISLNDSDPVDICEVHHCDGLLLCITKDYSRFVVWNPFLCQTLWLKPRSPQHPIRLDWYSYAIGYQMSSKSSRRNYKILRYVDAAGEAFVEYEIYELNSNSWRVLDITSGWEIEYYARGISLKGNTYWFPEYRNSLVCFDFTLERFGPPLPLPLFDTLVGEDTVTFSSFREEQLAVLFQWYGKLKMEVWVTTKIEPEVVSWSKLLLAVDMPPLTNFKYPIRQGSFFIDEEKKVVVVFDKDKDVFNNRLTRNIAYIFGEDGYYREVDLGESTQKHHHPFVCSYVPSSAQIMPAGGNREKGV